MILFFIALLVGFPLGTTGLYIFETYNSYYGNFGGLAKADAYCMAEANASSNAGRAWYGGVFKALISTSSPTVINAKDRFTGNTFPLYTDSSSSSTAWIASTLSQALSTSINVYDARGNVPQSTFYPWTGSTAQGTSYSNSDCNGWTSQSSNIRGEAGTFGTKWFDAGYLNCNSVGHFLCLQTGFGAAGQNGLYVFRTTTTYTGSALGGLSGADAICNSYAAANLPYLSGIQFLALLGTTTMPFTARTPLNKPLLSLSGAVLASNMSTALQKGLSITIPTGLSNSANSQCWTGADSVTTCADWTSSSSLIKGLTGDAYTTAWTNYQSTSCSISRQLMCIQVGDPCLLSPCDYMCTPQGAGRTCSCPPGSVGNGELGQCVNLVVSATPLSGKSGATVTGPGKLGFNTTNGGPVFTFRIAMNGTKKAPITNPSYNVSFTDLTFYSASAAISSGCDVLTPGFYMSSAANNGTTNITCVVGSGAGIGLSAILTWCVTFSGDPNSYCTAYTTPLVVNYVGPTIIGGTLRTAGGSAGTSLTVVPNAGVVLFSVQNIVTGIVQVFFGPVGNPLQYQCIVTAATTASTIVCIPDSDAKGTNMLFTVVVDRLNATGTDTLSVQSDGPVITSVSGCPTPAGIETQNCPTVGGLNLQVNGTGFLGNLSVLVDMKPCINPHANAAGTWLTCILPTGTGVERAILVSTQYFISNPKALISYAPPNITSIFAAGTCVSLDPFTLMGCGRSGGIKLTVNGANFGASGATILIGVVTCASVVHEGIMQAQLTCILPAGNFINQPISVSVTGGGTATVGSITYSYCPIGTQQNSVNTTDCSPCGLGTANGAPGLACAPCEVGKISEITGRTACVNCHVGLYQAGIGGSNCTQCQIGRYAQVPGLVSCLLCDIGTYADSTATSQCAACDVGTFQNSSGATTCFACPAGMYAGSQGQQVCSPCDLGKFSNTTAQSSCTTCDPGTFQNTTGQSRCNLCPSGRYSIVGGQVSCLPCNIGTYSNTPGAQQCKSCPAGTYRSSAGAASCTQCPGGTYSAAGQQQCDPCQLGEYGNGTTPCQACNEGAFANVSGLSTCYLCSNGRYSNSPGQVNCIPCDLGYYGQGVGQTGCAKCSTGSFQASAESTRCDACPVGQFNDADAQVLCKDCPTGKFANATGESACTSCTAGTYQQALGQGNCALCPPGRRSLLDGQDSCLPCDIGTFTSQPGRITCDPCPIGSYQPVAGASVCATCPAGSYASDPGQQQCGPCELGKYGNGSAPCDFCPIGQYQNSSGQGNCELCPVGRASDSPGLVVCLACEIGYYSGKPGAVACSKCEPGQYQDAVDASTCFACPTGKYSDAQGQFSCKDCPDGMYTNATGLTECASCAEGYYQPDSAQSQCSPCPAGSYTSSRGETDCKVTPPGYYAAAAGTAKIIACPTGSYQGQLGSTFCPLCPPGTFGAVPGLSECALCDAGRYSRINGSVSCVPCGTGQYQVSRGESACNYCAGGKYADTSTTCTDCSDNSVSAVGGDCLACPTGLYASADHGHCICPTGTYVQGIATCLPCPEGLECLQPGITINQTQTLAGWWRSSRMDNAPIRCVEVSNCLGQERCGTARMGVLCSLCIPGYRAAYFGGPCELCASKGKAIASSFAIFFVVMLGLLLVYAFIIYQTKGIEQQVIAAETSKKSTGDENSRNSAFTRDEGLGNGVGRLPAPSADSMGLFKNPALSFTDGSNSTINASGGKINHSGGKINSSGGNININQSGGNINQSGGNINQSGGNINHSGGNINRSGSVRPPAPPRPSGGSTMSLTRTGSVLPGINVRNADTLPGPIVRQSNLLAQLKIFVGFLQVVLAIVHHGDLTWPSAFASFLNALSFINFDFVPWQSLTCAVPLDGISQALVVACIPVAAVLIALPFPLILHLKNRFDYSDSNLSRVRRMTNWRKFVRVFLFTCFLFYPHVSSVIIGVFNCRVVDGVLYMKTDSTIICGSYSWRTRALPMIVFLFLYPVGVPALFFYLLHRNRRKLQTPQVTLSLGALYEPYYTQLFFFEIVEMLYKMTMTSLVAFVRTSYQLPLGLSISGAYLCVILVLDPYKRPIDHTLHTFLLADIVTLLMFGCTLQLTSGKLTDLANILLSIFLIALVMLMIFFFLVVVFLSTRMALYNWIRNRRMQKNPDAQQNFNLHHAAKHSRNERESSQRE